MYTAIDGALRMYLESLIVNCQGDPNATGKSFPDFETVLEWFYDSQMADLAFGRDEGLAVFWEIDPIGGQNDE